MTQTINGLVRKPQYEEVLNLAIKDANSQHGVLSVPLQRFATEVVNSPLYQRIKETMTEQIENEQRHVIEQRNFENHLHSVSVDARIPRDDLQWIVENLQRPPPPPPVPPPTTSEARIDYERMAAEMDGVMQRRAVQTSHENLASEIARELAQQRVATPIQQIIHQHHSTTNINPQPPPNIPPPASLSEQSTQTGQSFHESFLNRFDPPPRPFASTEFPAEWQRPRPIESKKSKPVKKAMKPKIVRPSTSPPTQTIMHPPPPLPPPARPPPGHPPPPPRPPGYPPAVYPRPPRDHCHRLEEVESNRRLHPLQP